MITRNRIFAVGIRLLIAALPLPAAAAELSVTLTGIPSANGRLMIAILGSEAAFKGERPPLLSMILPPRIGQVSFATDALSPGSYAVQVMQDENGNGELDSNLVGMPIEPWGFSNNAVGAFGPPGWSDISFSLEASTHLDIELNY